MKHILKSIITVLVIILTTLTPTFAQSPYSLSSTPEPATSKKPPTKPPTLWSYSDAIMLGGFTADLASTRYALSKCQSCREGGLPTKVRIPVQLGTFAFTKVWQWKKPGDRRGVRIFQMAVGGLYFGVAAWNMKKAQQR